MSVADRSHVERFDDLQSENVRLRERLERAERHTAQTLARATRLSQVISVLGDDADFATLVERAAVEIAELFSTDMALLMLGPDDACSVEGHCGLRPADVPQGPIALTGLDGLTLADPVMIGPASETALPEWLLPYGGQHVAWARLLVGEESLGLMLLVRRGNEPFERFDQKELRAVSYRIALAIENALLHRRMSDQLEQLHGIQAFTTRLAGALEIETVGHLVAEMLVTDVPVAASIVLIDGATGPVPVARCGCASNVTPTEAAGWTLFPLEATGRSAGYVAVSKAPAAGSEQHERLAHLLGLAALAVDKALLYDRLREQARSDSLTGLLGHRVFHERLEELTAKNEQFSVVLIDIDDFKQVNDLYGHEAGDDALRAVADALRAGVRDGDEVFRIGGEEFCAVLPGIAAPDAFAVSERMRTSAAKIVSALPVTISLGVASFPTDAPRREELLRLADAALYASKRSGKNRTSVAGAHGTAEASAAGLHAHISLLHSRDPGTVVHSVHVASIAVEIGRALGLADDRLEGLRIAAQLHDIGKIAVPPEILNKPGLLDEEEFRIVKTHPTVGAELLRASGLTTAANFVLQHHERIDGLGYPAGLHGDEIVLEARIIHAADAFVAMTLDRPYRPAMSTSDAFAELVRHRGTQFDPDVVDAMVDLDRLRMSNAA